MLHLYWCVQKWCIPSTKISAWPCGLRAAVKEHGRKLSSKACKMQGTLSIWPWNVQETHVLQLFGPWTSSSDKANPAIAPACHVPLTEFVISCWDSVPWLLGLNQSYKNLRNPRRGLHFQRLTSHVFLTGHERSYLAKFPEKFTLHVVRFGSEILLFFGMQEEAMRECIPNYTKRVWALHKALHHTHTHTMYHLQGNKSSCHLCNMFFKQMTEPCQVRRWTLHSCLGFADQKRCRPFQMAMFIGKNDDKTTGFPW